MSSLQIIWLWSPLLIGLLLVLWLAHLRIRNASLADIGFCLGFSFLVLACGVSSQGDLSRRILLMGMASAYAFRLGSHLLVHRVWSKAEDARYQRVRHMLGSWERVGIFLYFQFQVPACAFFAGLLCWIMSHPHDGLRLWDGVGIMIFLLAFTGETIADHQLESFRSQPINRGKTLRTGLWRYSRHPNYFFESLLWWAFVPMAVGLPWSWVAFLWPLLMMSSLLWITGVPWAEAQAVVSRAEDYRDYQRTTSMFIPWFPGKTT